jgi:hypothetical protein
MIKAWHKGKTSSKSSDQQETLTGTSENPPSVILHSKPHIPK